jgi:sec-independent protein translocase protein TatC
MADQDPAPLAAAEAEEKDSGKMSFFDHLTELRTRIIWSLVSAGVGLVIALFFTEWVMKYLVEHIIMVKPVFTTPTEAFWTYMKVAVILGLFISMPAILYQVWKFVAPGLHSHERKYAAPFILVSSVLFLLGGAFAIFGVVPFAMRFLVNFGQQQGLQPMISISSSIDFILKFTLAFGLVFELPVVITILSMMGVVTPKFLSRNRKYAILINFIIAAILTPTPDIFNQSLMAAPMCLLYEVGIICARIFGRKPQAKPAEAPASEGTAAT